MTTINVEKKFTMPIEDVRKGMEKIAKSLEQGQGMTWQWDNEDCVSFSHKAGKGTLFIEGDKLLMQIKMGILFAAVAPMIKKKVEAYAAKHIH